MGERDAVAAQTAALGALGEYARVSFDDTGVGFMPVIWVEGQTAIRLMQSGEFWMTLDLGAPLWVRFRLSLVAFNRAAFAAVEVRLALDPEQRPVGVWWPR